MGNRRLTNRQLIYEILGEYPEGLPVTKLHKIFDDIRVTSEFAFAAQLSQLTAQGYLKRKRRQCKECCTTKNYYQRVDL